MENVTRDGICPFFPLNFIDLRYLRSHLGLKIWIRTLTLWSMYNLLLNLFAPVDTCFLFSICINLVQFTPPNAVWQSVKQAHLSIVHSDIILSIPPASLHNFPLLNPNWPTPCMCIWWCLSTCGSTRELSHSTTAFIVLRHTMSMSFALHALTKTAFEMKAKTGIMRYERDWRD